MIAAAPVTVTAVSEHPSAPQDRRGLVVETGPVIAGRHALVGVAARDSAGWTAGTRRGVIRRRIDCTGHDSAHAAVTAILGSREARRLGITAWSPVRWSDAAARAARDAWGAGVTA